MITALTRKAPTRSNIDLSQQQVSIRNQHKLQLSRIQLRLSEQSSVVYDLESNQDGVIEPELPRLDASATSELRHASIKGCGNIEWSMVALAPVVAAALAAGVASLSVIPSASGATILHGLHSPLIKQISIQNAIGGAVLGGSIGMIGILVAAISPDATRGASGPIIRETTTNGVTVEHPCATVLNGLLPLISGIIASPIGIAILKAASKNHSTQQQGFEATGVGGGVIFALALVNLALKCCCRCVTLELESNLPEIEL